MRRTDRYSRYEAPVLIEIDLLVESGAGFSSEPPPPSQGGGGGSDNGQSREQESEEEAYDWL